MRENRMNLGDLSRVTTCDEINAPVNAEHSDGAYTAYTGEEQDVVESEYTLEHAWHGLGVDAVEATVGRVLERYQRTF